MTLKKQSKRGRVKALERAVLRDLAVLVELMPELVGPKPAE